MMKKINFVLLVSMFLLVNFASCSLMVGSSQNLLVTNSDSTFKLQSITHDHVNVSADYELVVGWLTEPPRVSQSNSVLIEINQFENNGATVLPVDHAEHNLTAIITKDSFSTSLQSLVASASESGAYTIPFKPTETGTYSLEINGTLGTSVINKTIPLDPVSSLSNNLINYLIIPLGIITIVGVGAIVIQKKRHK